MLVEEQTKKRHYEDPPLEEAIFELFVPPSQPWSTERGEQLSKLLPVYSGSREDLEDFNVVFQFGPGNSIAQGVNPGARRLRLWNAERTRAVQLGAEMCTHNVRKPYGHYVDHIASIRDLISAYLEVVRPPQLAWIGQRYLNIVRLPLEAVPADFFRMYPQLPPELPQRHRPFAVQVETASFEQGNTVVNLALLEITAEAAVYTIDVYARSDTSVSLDVESILAWQSRAHDSIGGSFELTITDNARRLFKEVPCRP